MIQKTLVLLMGTSLAVCGCSCSPKGGGGSKSQTGATKDQAPLTTAQISSLKGRFIGGLLTAPNGTKLADAAVTFDVFGGTADGAKSGAAGPALIAKLETSGATLSTVTLSNEVKFNSHTQKYEVQFIISDQALKSPLKLQFAFSLDAGHVTGELTDASGLSALAAGTSRLGAVATGEIAAVSEQSLLAAADDSSNDAADRTVEDLADAEAGPDLTDKTNAVVAGKLTDAVVNRPHHHHGQQSTKPGSKPSPNPSPTPVSAPAPVGEAGHLYLDLKVDTTNIQLPIIDSKKMKAPVLNYYTGTTTFTAGATKPVEAQVNEPAVSSDLALYAAVATQGIAKHLVVITTSYGMSASLQFAPALMDDKSGSITGASALGAAANSSILLTSCENNAKKNGFDCNQTIAAKSAAVTHLVLSNSPPKNDDTPSDDNSIKHVYRGMARFNGQPTSVELTVSYSGSSAEETILSLFEPSVPHQQQLSAKFFLTGTITGVLLPVVKYDENAKTLSGIRPDYKVKDVSVDIRLECSNFTFGPPDSVFSCIYTNSLLPGPVPFQFPSK